MCYRRRTGRGGRLRPVSRTADTGLGMSLSRLVSSLGRTVGKDAGYAGLHACGHHVGTVPPEHHSAGDRAKGAGQEINDRDTWSRSYAHTLPAGRATLSRLSATITLSQKGATSRDSAPTGRGWTGQVRTETLVVVVVAGRRRHRAFSRGLGYLADTLRGLPHKCVCMCGPSGGERHKS